MKIVILAGGYGTRISEESHLKPKPMIEVGGRPILWHIMKSYAHHGFTEFVICCGYKGYVIKEYFANYFLHLSDVTFDMSNNTTEVHQNSAEPWKVTLVDTGEDTMTGGRVLRVKKYLGNDDFCLTYGDGLSDVNISELIRFHKSHGKIGTVTAIQPPGRFGSLELDGTSVKGFQEKPAGDGNWINGGFFVFSPKILDYIEDDDSVLEKAPLQNLCKANNLASFFHKGFWHPMDTMRDKTYLEDLWQSGKAPWKKWG